MLRFVASAFLLATTLSATAQTAVQQPQQRFDAPATKAPARELRSPDVVFVPTPPEVVEAMLNVAKVGSGDVMYDLGSGDGRIPIMAAQKFNVTRATGIDINPERIKEAEANLRAAGVGDRVRFVNADLFEADFRDATVITLYLLPELNVKLLPKLLRETKPGTRIVSHAFLMGSWQPEQTLSVNGRNVFLWRIPERGTPAFETATAAASNRPN